MKHSYPSAFIIPCSIFNIRFQMAKKLNAQNFTEAASSQYLTVVHFEKLEHKKQVAQTFRSDDRSILNDGHAPGSSFQRIVPVQRPSRLKP